MSWTEFDCVVVGDEVAALWLLRQFSELARNEKSPEIRLGWVRLHTKTRPLAIPHALREKLGLDPKPPFSAEIRTPKRDIVWSPEHVRQKYGFTPPRWGQLSTSEESQIRYCFQKFPEVFEVGSVLWSRLGRSGTLSPERLVEAAFRLTELSWVSLDEVAPPQTTVFHYLPSESPLKKITKLRSGEYSFEFAAGQPLVSRTWILAPSYLEIQQWKAGGFDLNEFLGINISTPSHGFFGFGMTLEKDALSERQKDMCLWADADEIPDSETEVWSFDISHDEKTDEISVYAEAPLLFPFDLDMALTQMRESVKRFTRLVPWLPEKVRSFEFPMSLDSCSRDESRAELEPRLWHNVTARYQMATLETRTRHNGLYLLPTSFHAELPYPMGTLRGAQEILIDRFGRRGVKKVAVATPPAIV